MRTIKKDMLVTGIMALLTSLVLVGVEMNAARSNVKGWLQEKKNAVISCGLDWSDVSIALGSQNSHDPGKEKNHPGGNEGNGCMHQLTVGLLVPTRGKNRDGKPDHCS